MGRNALSGSRSAKVGLALAQGAEPDAPTAPFEPGRDSNQGSVAETVKPGGAYLERRPGKVAEPGARCRSTPVGEVTHTGAAVDAKALSTKLDRVLAMRGDPATGAGASAWQESLAEVDPDLILRAVILAVRELLVPDWAATRKQDTRPQQALDAAQAWIDTKSPEAAAAAKTAAKGCTAARSETFGQDHRVPEAARHAAWAPAAKDTSGLFDALAATERELLARIALTGELHRGPEQRRAIVAILKRVILPPEPVAEAMPPAVVSTEPVPYSPEGHFELGQRLTHKKFGGVTVTSVGETWIEVEIPADKSNKRLAHKP